MRKLLVTLNLLTKIARSMIMMVYMFVRAYMCMYVCICMLSCASRQVTSLTILDFPLSLIISVNEGADSDAQHQKLLNECGNKGRGREFLKRLIYWSP